MKLASISFEKIVLIAMLTIAFGTVTIGGVSVSVTNHDRVIMGVQSGGANLSGMTESEVLQYFKQVGKSKLSRPAALLMYKERSWTINPEDIHLRAEAEKAAKEAYAVGRTGILLRDILTQMQCAIFGKNIILAGAYDQSLLDNVLKSVKAQIDTQPVNAAVELHDSGAIKKIPAVTGLTLDTTPIKEDLDSKFKSLHVSVRETLQPSIQEPFITNEDIAAIDTVLGSYTTSFLPGARGDNISIAASHLQGVLIRSQSTLSFNDIVGRRTRTAGYKNAGVIIDGEPAIDVGGGVCQVSSTLYNAVLLAGMKPTVRSSHFLPSHYVPAGRDATVADDLLDFVFQNPLPHPVYLVVGNTGTELTVSVLGTRADLTGQTIALVTEGSQSHPSLYRIWSKNGQVVNQEYMHTDNYS